MISVLMPVYNSQNYLEESINSILSQTYTNFEFLIYDDN
jgi:glycosyltransferase involved in cell wall biosynthesis